MIKIKRDYGEKDQVVREMTFDEDGWLCKDKSWYNNGNLAYISSQKNGKLHGILKGWCKDGTLWYTKYYLYDEEVSEEEYRKHELITQLAGIK